MAACASLCLDLVVPVQSCGLIFHWACFPCWCLDRIHSASEPSGSRGCIDGCIGHVGSQHAPWSYLRSSGDWTQGSHAVVLSRGRGTRPGPGLNKSLPLARCRAGCVSRSLGCRFWFKNTAGRGGSRGFKNTARKSQIRQKNDETSSRVRSSTLTFLLPLRPAHEAPAALTGCNSHRSS